MAVGCRVNSPVILFECSLGQRWVCSCFIDVMYKGSKAYQHQKQEKDLHHLMSDDNVGETLNRIGKRDFTEIERYIEGQEGIEAVYVYEENEDIQLGNTQGRGINISVWLEPNVTRNFGSAYVGMHGYLNTNTDMQGIFLVAGPGIKQNAVIGGMNTIDVAPTVLSLLDIDTGFTCDGIPLATIKSPRTEAFSYPVEETSFSYLSFMLVILIIPIVNRIRRKRK